MKTEIEKLEAAIAAANEKLAELKAAEAAQAEKAWPQNGDRYWTLDDSADIFEATWASDSIDRSRFAIGNVFRTKTDAERGNERRIVLTTLRQLARGSWGGDKADWSNCVQDKWYLFCDHSEQVWRIDYGSTCQRQGAIYFATREAAQAAIETIGADRLMGLLED